MDDGAGPDDEASWAPPTRHPAPGAQPPPPPAVDPPGPPAFDPPRPPAGSGRIDRGGATLAAGLFGALAGITLPPLLFWITFSLLDWLGAPDTATALGALAVAFVGPLLLFVRVMGLLGRSSPRHDGARTALTIAASVTMGMWLLLAAVSTLIVVVLRDMG